MPKLTGRAMRAAAIAAAAVVVAATLAGCDRQKIARLEEGVSTEADVRREFGEPAAVFPEADGSRTLEYPRQPEGAANYLITIAPDGRMASLRQVLQPATFQRVSPGLDKAEVRRLLGRPASAVPYALANQEVWDWRWQDGNQAKVFRVTFDADGRVVSTATVDDPRLLEPNSR